MIVYTASSQSITPRQLDGFFVGWRSPLSPETHLRILAGSDHILLAIDTTTDQVVGFITALSDGVQSAFIPLLEVLPAYQGLGIGESLMRQMLARLEPIPNVDLLCDPDVVPFYERFGMHAGIGMALRRTGRVEE